MWIWVLFTLQYNDRRNLLSIFQCITVNAGTFCQLRFTGDLWKSGGLMKRRLSHSASSASAYSAMILKRTPNITDSSDFKDVDNDLPQALPKNRWSTLKTRSLYGTIMLVGLYCVLISGPLAIIGLIAAVQTLVFKEVISIAHFRSQEKKLPWFRTITWYLFD